jgi:hypothetical protein
MKYRLSLPEQLAMMLRGSPVGKIKSELKKAERYNLELDGTALEAHFLAQGDITDLVDSLIFAQENGMKLSPMTAMAQQFILKHQGEIKLRDKLNSLKDTGISDLDTYLTKQSIQSELDNA